MDDKTVPTAAKPKAKQVIAQRTKRERWIRLGLVTLVVLITIGVVGGIFYIVNPIIGYARSTPLPAPVTVVATKVTATLAITSIANAEQSNTPAVVQSDGSDGCRIPEPMPEKTQVMVIDGKIYADACSLFIVNTYQDDPIIIYGKPVGKNSSGIHKTYLNNVERYWWVYSIPLPDLGYPAIKAGKFSGFGCTYATKNNFSYWSANCK